MEKKGRYCMATPLSYLYSRPVIVGVYLISGIIIVVKSEMWKKISKKIWRV
jgi:hypothetical protein